MSNTYTNGNPPKKIFDGIVVNIYDRMCFQNQTFKIQVLFYYSHNFYLDQNI